MSVFTQNASDRLCDVVPVPAQCWATVAGQWPGITPVRGRTSVFIQDFSGRDCDVDPDPG